MSRGAGRRRLRARLLRPAERAPGRGRVELTPSASSVHFSDEGSERVQDEFGLQVATDVHQKLDLRARYARVQVNGGDDLDGGAGVNVLGFGPKLSLVRDRLALAVPVGFSFGGGIDSRETWQVQPTVIGTVPLALNLDLTASGKYLIPLTADDADNLWALNLGLGLGPSDRWVIRPEVGFLWNPGESGHFRHVSVGLSVMLDR